MTGYDGSEMDDAADGAPGTAPGWNRADGGRSGDDTLKTIRLQAYARGGLHLSMASARPGTLTPSRRRAALCPPLLTDDVLAAVAGACYAGALGVLADDGNPLVSQALRILAETVETMTDVPLPEATAAAKESLIRIEQRRDAW